MPELLRDVILNATFAPNRAINSSVTKINLGAIGDSMQELRRITASDPLKRETGRLIYVTPDRRVLLQNGFFQGEPEKTNFRIDSDPLNPPPYYSRPPGERKYLGSAMHTHGAYEVPPSGQDLGGLLLGNNERFAETAAIVLTPATNTIIFRGPATPNLTDLESNAKVALWFRNFTERMDMFLTPYLTREETINMNARAITALIKQIAQKYDLKIFKGFANSSVVDLES